MISKPVADLLFRPYTGTIERVESDMLALARHVREHDYANPLDAFNVILDDVIARSPNIDRDARVMRTADDYADECFSP